MVAWVVWKCGGVAKLLNERSSGKHKEHHPNKEKQYIMDCSMRRYVEFKQGTSTEPALREEESLDYRIDSTKIAFSSGQEAGVGELIVTSKRILWIGKGESYGKAYDFDVPFIILHAISRDPDSYPAPCIYCQLDVDFDTDENDENGDHDRVEDDVGSEVYFIPPNEHQLEEMFDAFSKAALQNPDPQTDDEEDDIEGVRVHRDGYDEGITETSTGFICNTDEITPGSKEAAILEHLDSVFSEPH